MKRKYEKLSLLITLFAEKDVICSSNETEPDPLQLNATLNQSVDR